MELKEIESKVKDVLVESLDVEEEKITMDSNLIDDLDIDSLELVDLTMEFENEFDIEIEDDQVEKIKTVGDIVNLIKEKLG
ncbi:acyl carrier protein [Geotoga petraea]|jgi:acyl carrier protein|uniref:Acyl carrier protein n=1 Tax=Geotoga petraea TaxID=28234 RepID=A0A1G6KZ92_9BACT|nr:acyl carrier protein [Geotoga petraea]MDK2946572.1 acyl carrier protein [Geotoga sp.]TGG88789.1 acyl carrier protein [Geotoga petraea]SDC36422.1 acyl carrier protein [Geotoga petraea]